MSGRVEGGWNNVQSFFSCDLTWLISKDLVSITTRERPHYCDIETAIVAPNVMQFRIHTFGQPVLLTIDLPTLAPTTVQIVGKLPPQMFVDHEWVSLSLPLGQWLIFPGPSHSIRFTKQRKTLLFWEFRKPQSFPPLLLLLKPQWLLPRVFAVIEGRLYVPKLKREPA